MERWRNFRNTSQIIDSHMAMAKNKCHVQLRVISRRLNSVLHAKFASALDNLMKMMFVHVDDSNGTQGRGSSLFI